jgi:hypothetical protein
VNITHDEALRVGVARAAIRLVWTVTIRAPQAVFADSVIAWTVDAPADLLSESTAAERLAGLPRPVILRGEERLSKGMTLMVSNPSLAPPADEQRPRALDFLSRTGDRPVLVLAAGWAYRLSPVAIHHLVRDYHFAAPLGGCSGPPEDPWTLQLNLPHSWLDGCGFVWLVGRSDSHSMHSPMRMGDEWNAQALVVV